MRHMGRVEKIRVEDAFEAAICTIGFDVPRTQTKP